MDTGKTNIGYLLGRFYGVHEEIEHAATKENKFLSPQKQTYYIRIPRYIIPELTKKKINEWDKNLNDERKEYYENLIGEIVNGIDAGNEPMIPEVLNPNQQNDFFMGYYHQKNKFKEEE